MRRYAVFFVRSARKELESLSGALRQRMLGKATSLGGNPRPPACRKLQGSRNLWRIRMGDYRMVYSVDPIDHEVVVIAIRHRSDVYR